MSSPMRGRTHVVTLGAVLLAAPVAPAVPQTRLVETAVVRPIDGTLDGPPLFTFQRVTTSNGSERVVHVRFTTPAAEPALHDIVTYLDGRVVRYESSQHQTDERATLTVRGDRATIERTARPAGTERGDGAPPVTAGVRGEAPPKQGAHVRASRARSGANGVPA